MLKVVRWAASLNLLIVVLLLAGCGTLGGASKSAPPPQIPESTWWQVESDVSAASLAAKGLARDYAYGALRDWRDRVRQRTESDFIPWFTGYWTQRWLGIKVAWYKMNAGEDRDAALVKLSAYLEEKYRNRVLSPVAKEIDPNVIRRQATALYVENLQERIHQIPSRYGIPRQIFEERLKAVPAIALATPQGPGASLYQVAYNRSPAKLPAYQALMEGMSKDAGQAGTGFGDGKVSPTARWAGSKLNDNLAASGGASAAAAIIRGFPGFLVSLAMTGAGVAANERDRPEMEARLRKDLYAAIDDLWYAMMEDLTIGVLAGVYSISGQIEDGLTRTRAQPVVLQPEPLEAPLSIQ